MPLVINTNVSSLNAQRQLVNSGNEMSSAMERLSSGKRINSAADDAAGLAISNRMTSQVRGLTQAIRNANDGISLIQTAEGAMDETTNILQRMRELAIQAANGIYSDADRGTLDAEVQQLKEELDRIANSTTFNGQLLLDGSLGDVELQIGALANQTITMNIEAMNIKKLGGESKGDVVGATMGGAPNTLANITGTGDGILQINRQNVGNLAGAANMKEVLELFNTNVSGVKTTAFTELSAQAVGTGIMRNGDTMTLTLEQIDGSVNSYEIGDTGSMAELSDKINRVTGGAIKSQLDDLGRLVLSNNDGAAISVGYTGAAAANTGIDAGMYRASLSFESVDGAAVLIEYGDDAAQDAAALGFNARATPGDVSGFGVATGDIADLAEGDVKINGVTIDAVVAGATGLSAMTALQQAINAKSAEHGVVATVVALAGDAARLELNSVSGEEMSLELSGAATPASTGLVQTNVAVTQGDAIADISIGTAEGAQEAIVVIDNALEQINATRAQLGAINNRLDFAMSNLSNVVENTSAARSRIIDADFAKETAELSRAQVLQQASQAMLAQANAQPQQVLQLLQG